MLTLAALAAALAQAAPATAQAQDGARPAPDPDTIVIYGRRAERDLAECLARACPPAEDIEASAQASVFQFGAGRYADAAETLRAAIRRNEAYTARYPGQVASLHATLATVLQHDGNLTGMRHSATRSADILAEHVGRDHEATLTERLALGDLMIRLGQPLSAEAIYRDVAERAEASGQPMLAGTATMRRAWLALYRRRNDEARGIAATALAQAPGNAQIALDHRLLTMRVQAGRADAAIARAAETFAGEPPMQPRLVFAPPYPDFNRGSNADTNSGVQFADIGFFIRADGVVEDVAYLRGQGLGQYHKALLTQVAERRYTPFVPPAGEGGVHRVERVTLRGDIDTPTGSRIPRRLGDRQLRVEVADLTATREMAEKALAAAQDSRTSTPRTP